MSVTKLYILQEIRRTTKANGGTPLRKLQFESETGIKRYNWFGVYWARWSDAIREAGYMQDHIEEATRPQHPKPLRYDRDRPAHIVRLA
jgi:hypothetical protein